MSGPRFGVVVQRYGPEIVGGAEAHARMVALRLAQRFGDTPGAVTVLTSCAADWETWENRLPEGEAFDGLVRVRRFSVQGRRLTPVQIWLDRAVSHPRTQRVARRLGRIYAAAQGPRVPGLLDALRRERFDRVIFVSYLYHPTIAGVPIARASGAQVDFIPTAHDEAPLRFLRLQRAFHLAHRVACNTESERRLIQRMTGVGRHKLDVVGCGTDFPGTLPAAPTSDRYRVEGDFALYLGRDKHGVELLAPAFRRSGLRLVVAGSAQVDGALNLGPVGPQDKWWLLSRATVVVQPSRFESLGLTLIEAWQARKPVIVNAASEVLREQVAACAGGLVFRDDAAELARCVDLLAGDASLRTSFGAAGHAFAERYDWDAIVRYFAGD